MKTSRWKSGLVILTCLALSGAAWAASFSNGGFEDGTTNGWTIGGGLWSAHPGWPQNFNDYTDPAQYMGAVVTPGPDPIIGSVLNQVFSGSYAMRVNDSSPNYHVSTIKQTIVNYTDTNMYFAWAAVLQSSHGPTDSGNFTLQLRDDTAGSNLIERTYSSATAGPIFTNYGGWYATAWQVEQLDVSSSTGHTFTLSVLASDCAQGGHGGYVYVDAFGAAPPVPTPSTADVTVDVNPSGSGSTIGSGTYDPGTNIVISASPSNGWLFVNWNDSDTNSTRTITVPPTNITYTANFAPAATITVNMSPNGGGSSAGSGTFFVGSNDVISASPAPGWRVRWNDGDTNTSRNINVVSNVTYTANFLPIPRIYFQETSCQVASWTLDAAGTFLSTAVLGDPGQWRIKAVGDIDGDFVGDLLFQTTIGEIGVWYMNADGTVRAAQYLGNVGGWLLRACGDYDADGRPELFFQDPGGTVAYWQINTSGVPTNVVVVGNTADWQLKLAADVDNDGKADLFWQRPDGLVAAWRHNGPGGTIQAQLIGYGPGWTLVGATDIDGDGSSDLLWQSVDTGIAAWFMNADGTLNHALYWGVAPLWLLQAGGN